MQTLSPFSGEEPGNEGDPVSEPQVLSDPRFHSVEVVLALAVNTCSLYAADKRKVKSLLKPP